MEGLTRQAGNDQKPYNIEYKQDGVFLTVVPSNTIEKLFLISQIIDFVTAKKIRGVDQKAVQSAVEKADGKPVKIADKQEEVKDVTSMVISISQDKMVASISLLPPQDGKKLASNEIVKMLYSKGITYGIEYETIDKIAQNPQYNVNIEIARGSKPGKGEDGKIELLFETNTDRKPRILEDGSVDFHELNYAVSVKKGQLLANIIQPKPGKEGFNVLGQIMPALKGKPSPIPRGKNVEITNNGTGVSAVIDGCPSFVDNKVNVLNVMDIPGNVDISTGNIRFTGNVIVRGNVLTDFVVEAGGDVEVYGVVEGATIKADGDIILKRGIQGNLKGALVSGHDIIARFIEHSNVTAKNDIKCEAIMHCVVRCGNIIDLAGRKGLIVGGNIKAGKEIRAKVLGSQMCTTTDIEVGTDPTIRDRYKELKDKFSSTQSELYKTEKSIEVLKKMQSSSTLNQDKLNMLNKLIQLYSYLQQQYTELQDELTQIDEALQQKGKGRIKVQNMAYPGVKITIGSASKFIKENIQYTTFYLDGAEIKSGSYEA